MTLREGGSLTDEAVAPESKLDWSAKAMLDAAEEWAMPCYWTMREACAGVEGRIDGLLIPHAFDASVLRNRRGYWTQKLAVVGVEVKSSRKDFERGLREGQFERYARTLAGLFVLTGPEVKTAEVPKECGHLIAYRTKGWGDYRVVARRNPKWRDQELDPDTAWRIVYYAGAQVRKQKAELRHEQDRRMERIGHHFARVLAGLNEDQPRPEAVSNLRKAVEARET